MRLWDSESGRKLLSFSELRSRPTALAFDRKDSCILIGDESGVISVHSVALRGIERNFETKLGAIKFLAFNRAGDVLISASDQGVALWNWPESSPRELPKGADWGQASVALSSANDGNFLALDASNIFLWNESNPESLLKYRATVIEPPKTLKICALAMGRDPTKIYAALSDRSLRLYDCGPTNLRTLASSDIPSENPSSIPSALALSPSGKPIIALSDGSIRRLSADLVSTEQIYSGHRGAVTGLIPASSKGALYSAGEDSSLRRWTEDGAETWPRRGHSGGVRALRFSSPDSIISIGEDGAFLRWRSSQRRGESAPEVLRQIDPTKEPLWAISPDNQHLALATASGEIGISSLEKNTIRWAPLLGTSDKVRRLSALDLSLSELLVGDNKGRLKSFPYLDGQLERPKSEDIGESPITALTQSPQWRRVVGFASGEIKARRADSKDLPWKTLSIHSSKISALLLLSEDRLVSSAENGRLVLSSLESDESKVLSHESPDGQVTGLALSPDGSSLAVAFAKGMINLYDLRKPLQDVQWEVVKLNGFDEKLQGIAFSPDARQLAVGTAHGPILIFEITSP